MKVYLMPHIEMFICDSFHLPSRINSDRKKYLNREIDVVQEKEKWSAINVDESPQAVLLLTILPYHNPDKSPPLDLVLILYPLHLHPVAGYGSGLVHDSPDTLPSNSNPGCSPIASPYFIQHQSFDPLGSQSWNFVFPRSKLLVFTNFFLLKDST